MGAGVEDNETWSYQQFRLQLGENWQLLREWLFARRVCRESLAAYEAVKRRNPALAGNALYQAAITRRTRLDDEGARHLLARAHASRLDWDNERPPSFRDVVLFMIVTEYLARSKGVQGMTMDLGSYLDRRMPEGL
jgi:hypothetical protein